MERMEGGGLLEASQHSKVEYYLVVEHVKRRGWTGLYDVVEKKRTTQVDRYSYLPLSYVYIFNIFLAACNGTQQ